jgi:hypothetical protein
MASHTSDKGNEISKGFQIFAGGEVKRTHAYIGDALDFVLGAGFLRPENYRLKLEREPENSRDSNAIMILGLENGLPRQIGYADLSGVKEGDER